ncbi:MAG: bacteriorhodopsin [Pseudorhodobacter sp.]|nr:bacteriorhodopsin [Frankiaceae bacterium]
MDIAELTSGQYDTVYNLLSLAIASLFFTGLYLVLSQQRVLPRYRNALVVSATVCFIATYHYIRIFNNFKESYTTDAIGGNGVFKLTEIAFNEGYRYVDWFLTVPLLLVETIAVLALSRAAAKPLLVKLVIASGLMIALGYPGEITTDTGTRLLWGTLSTIPFIYILYVLFVEINSSLERQPAQVRSTLRKLTIMLVGLWGVYPIAYLMPVLGFDGPQAFVLRQAGYSLADILAKAAFALVIFKIARMKSMADEPDFDDHDFDAPLEVGTPAQSRV